MRLTIINIANKMPTWVLDACAEYLKRINHGKYSCKLLEIKSDKRQSRTKLENMQYEAEKIDQLIPAGSFIIILDEHGKSLTSIEFASKLEQIALMNPDICFIIGGADGLHPNLKTKAHLMLQLSSFTYPHALVRVIILEQLYRAIYILNNHPYHRE